MDWIHERARRRLVRARLRKVRRASSVICALDDCSMRVPIITVTLGKIRCQIEAAGCWLLAACSTTSVSLSRYVAETEQDRRLSDHHVIGSEQTNKIRADPLFTGIIKTQHIRSTYTDWHAEL